MGVRVEREMAVRVGGGAGGVGVGDQQHCACARCHLTFRLACWSPLMYSTWHRPGSPAPNQENSGCTRSLPWHSQGPRGRRQQTSSCVHLFSLFSSSQVEWGDCRGLEVEQKGIRVKPEIFACLPTLQSLQLASDALLQDLIVVGPVVAFLGLEGINTPLHLVGMCQCYDPTMTLYP